MKRARRAAAALLAAAIAALGLSTTVGATGGADNSAIAVNTRDNSSLFRLGFSITRVRDQVVDSVNTALAYASCTGCQTVAIAIQVILATGIPSVVAPVNQAIAINYLCNLCDTLATAYQFVIGTGQDVRLTGQGREEIARIREELRALRDSHLTGPAIQERVAALMADLRTVLATQLVPVSGSEGKEGTAAGGQPASPTATPSGTTTPAPGPTPTTT